MELLEILKYVLPAAIVFLTSYLTIRSFLEKEERKHRHELNMNNNKLVTPLKLQAYERIVLFLERITPDALLVRVASNNINARQMQTFLLTTIRQEYEHNISQQIYVSPDAWEAVKTAKESITKLVNAAAMRLDDEASALDLSKLMIEMYLAVEESPTTYAIVKIKNEIQEIL